MRVLREEEYYSRSFIVEQCTHSLRSQSSMHSRETQFPQKVLIMKVWDFGFRYAYLRTNYSQSYTKEDNEEKEGRSDLYTNHGPISLYGTCVHHSSSSSICYWLRVNNFHTLGYQPVFCSHHSAIYLSVFISRYFLRWMVQFELGCLFQWLLVMRILNSICVFITRGAGTFVLLFFRLYYIWTRNTPCDPLLIGFDFGIPWRVFVHSNGH